MLKSKAVKFSLVFLTLFLVTYYFNIGFLSITSPLSKNYISVIADNFNYIKWIRHALLFCTSVLLRCFGFENITNDYDLLTVGRGIVRMAYDCLGIGVMCFFSAFVLAYPKPFKKKLSFLLGGLLIIQTLNVIRMALVAIFWDAKFQAVVDHHFIFNTIIYTIIGVALYFWVTADDRKKHAKN